MLAGRKNDDKLGPLEGTTNYSLVFIIGFPSSPSYTENGTIHESWLGEWG